MICEVRKKEIKKFKPTNILPQTPFWGSFKEEFGLVKKGFELHVKQSLLTNQPHNNNILKEDLLVQIKYLNNQDCFAYIPYGPKLEPTFENQGVLLEEVAEKIQPHLPQNCLFIRFDLAWENQWANEHDFFDEKGNWLGPPKPKTQEFRVNYKTNNWKLKKSVQDSLPKNTFFLNISKTESELLKNMRYNTRYNIKKALKNGIQVKEYNKTYIHEWYKLYKDTAIRKGMPLQDKTYFLAALENSRTNKEQVKMLMADVNGTFLASMFLVITNKRATYLYGASAQNKQNMQASYALQWESIKLAKKLGCTEYDMFGSAPNLKPQHPLHGVHVYKKGFGGKLYHRMGCWDYPYHNQKYQAYRLKEMG